MSTIALAVSIALDELEEAAPAAAPPPAPPEPAVAAPPPPPPRPAASFGASLAATLGYGILGLRRPRSPLPARR